MSSIFISNNVKLNILLKISAFLMFKQILAFRTLSWRAVHITLLCIKKIKIKEQSIEMFRLLSKKNEPEYLT